MCISRPPWSHGLPPYTSSAFFSRSAACCASASFHNAATTASAGFCAALTCCSFILRPRGWRASSSMAFCSKSAAARLLYSLPLSVMYVCSILPVRALYFGFFATTLLFCPNLTPSLLPPSVTRGTFSPMFALAKSMRLLARSSDACTPSRISCTWSIIACRWAGASGRSFCC